MVTNISVICHLIQNIYMISYLILHSQALSLSRICSSEKNFKGHIDQMKEWSLAKDYPEMVVKTAIFGKSHYSRKNSKNGIFKLHFSFCSDLSL